MSTEHKVRWLLLLSILGLVAWLVALDMVRSDTSYGLYVKTSYSDSIKPEKYALQPADNVQKTRAVQKTQNGAQLHNLSDGIELLPVDMLRYGSFKVTHTEYTGDYGLECVYNCDDYELMLDGLKHSYESF